MLKARPAGRIRSPRLMGEVYSEILRETEAVGWAPPRRRVSLGKARLLWIVLRHGLVGLMRPAHVYVVGAGLAGLSAAVRLAGRGARGACCRGARARPAGAAAPTSTPRSA